jgi:hypothetical protein
LAAILGRVDLLLASFAAALILALMGVILWNFKD